MVRGRLRTTLAGSATAIALALAVSLALTPVAGGHVAKFKTKVTIRNVDNVEYRGKVSSRKRPCIRRRAISLYRNEPREVIGTDKSDRKGRWLVELLIPGDDYYARAARRVITRSGHRHVCRAGRSPDSAYPARVFR